MSNVFRGDRVVVYDEHQQMRPGGDGYVHDFDRSALIIALAEDETVQARFLWNLPGDMRNRTLVVTMPLSEWRLRRPAPDEHDTAVPGGERDCAAAVLLWAARLL